MSDGKWYVETIKGRIEAPTPERIEHGWICRWVSPTSGYQRVTPHVPTRSGAVAVWAGMAGHAVLEIDWPHTMGEGPRCEAYKDGLKCPAKPEPAETEDEACEQAERAGWWLKDLTLCPEHRPTLDGLAVALHERHGTQP